MIYWLKQAAGPLVIFLHGFTGDVHAWDEVAARLPPHLAAVAIALPGHHPDAPACSDFVATCDWLAAQVGRLTAAPAHLVGYSLGARLALGIALRHPALLDRLTLIGGHLGLETQKDIDSRQEADLAWCALLEARGIEDFVKAWQSQAIFASQHDLTPAQQAQQLKRRLQHDPLALAASLRSTGLSVMPNYWPQLSQLTLATQFVVGDKDQKFTQLVRRAHALAPHTRVETIAGCGHNPLVEAPAALAHIVARPTW